MEDLVRSLSRIQSIDAVKQSFQDVLRKVQIERRAHISALPFELRFKIGNHLSKNDDFELISNLHVWCHVLGKDVSLWFIKHIKNKLKSWCHRIKSVCDNITCTFDWPKSVIILMADEENKIKCTDGTDNNYFIACIDRCFNLDSIRSLVQNATAINIQVHEAVLLKNSLTCPWSEYDSISINVSGNKRKIWWINGKPVHQITLRA
jgi:hypothetical protein